MYDQLPPKCHWSSESLHQQIIASWRAAGCLQQRIMNISDIASSRLQSKLKLWIGQWISENWKLGSIEEVFDYLADWEFKLNCKKPHQLPLHEGNTKSAETDQQAGQILHFRPSTSETPNTPEPDTSGWAQDEMTTSIPFLSTQIYHTQESDGLWIGRELPTPNTIWCLNYIHTHWPNSHTPTWEIKKIQQQYSLNCE